jgi:hypothetical protein
VSQFEIQLPLTIMAWALMPGYDGVVSPKTLFYLSLAASALFALAAVMNVLTGQWLVVGSGSLGRGTVVWLSILMSRYWRRHR